MIKAFSRKTISLIFFLLNPLRLTEAKASLGWSHTEVVTFISIFIHLDLNDRLLFLIASFVTVEVESKVLLFFDFVPFRIYFPPPLPPHPPIPLIYFMFPIACTCPTFLIHLCLPFRLWIPLFLPLSLYLSLSLSLSLCLCLSLLLSVSASLSLYIYLSLSTPLSLSHHL